MKYLITLFTSMLIVACAKPHVVSVTKPTDETLNCEQLAAEIAELQRFKDEAESEKGVNWSNAGRLIVFPIGLWATYDNANQAINAANQREIYLRGIRGRKNCP